jgi:hypothetical protein
MPSRCQDHRANATESGRLLRCRFSKELSTRAHVTSGDARRLTLLSRRLSHRSVISLRTAESGQRASEVPPNVVGGPAAAEAARTCHDRSPLSGLYTCHELSRRTSSDRVSNSFVSASGSYMARADESQDDEPAPDQQAEVIQAVARTVWAILQSCRLNFATGELNDSLFRVVPSLVVLRPDSATSSLRVRRYRDAEAPGRQAVPPWRRPGHLRARRADRLDVWPRGSWPGASRLNDCCWKKYDATMSQAAGRRAVSARRIR